MKKLLSILILLLATSQTWAQRVDFAQHFADSTLRLDYIFAGGAKNQSIYLDELCLSSGWYGRRVNLDYFPVEGNGQIVMRDSATGELIYSYNFSTLFQEWQNTEEATKVQKSFENSYLVPYPKHPVDITVTLTDNHRKVIGRLTHHVDPSDILIRHLPTSECEVRKIGPYGDPKIRIDVAILAEGYTLSEADKFYAKAEETVKALLSHEAFKTYKDRFNFIAVMTPSKDSGVSVPKDEIWKSTAFDSHFSTFYSDRYLTTLHVRQIHNAIVGIPYEHLIILANTETYGGGGILNSYTLTTSDHSSFAPVVVHEFGHSFGGLADEYFYDDQYESYYPADTEPWEQNITTMVDFSSKWEDMLGCSGVGVLEGGGYQSKGVWRPCEDCRMRTNKPKDFCPVCTRALKRMIEFYTETK